MYNLRRKRKRIFLGILAVVVSNSVVTAAPYLNMEIEKNIFLTFANIVMFIIIWDIYFDEKLSHASLWGILKDLLAVTAVSVVTTFVTYRLIIKTITGWVSTWGDFGWLVGGTLAGIATAVLGAIWAAYCDDLYRNSVVK